MPDRDDLDRLLDNALSTYADPGPHLARNVLAHVTARNAASQHRAPWLWAIGLATATAVTVLLVSIAPWRTPLSPHTAPRTQAVVLPSPAPAQHVVTALPARHAVLHPAVRRALINPAPPPKQEIFPAPSPLSNEEQALIQLVSTLPPAQQKHLMQTQQQPVEPLHIAAISIPPLEPAPQAER
ncbi:MAG: hypothetical protein P4L40_07320 [Terracidiphilus sp.]|nr:hypothetical protein [Terracidiphilus sp.]